MLIGHHLWTHLLDEVGQADRNADISLVPHTEGDLHVEVDPM